MEDKSCPHCIKRVNSKTNVIEFVCKKSGKKCNSSKCSLEGDNYEDNYGHDSIGYNSHYDY